MGEQEHLLKDALAKQQRAEQDVAGLKKQLNEERDAAAAARERSNASAVQGLAGREELAALRAQMATALADLAKAKLDAKVLNHSTICKLPLSQGLPCRSRLKLDAVIWRSPFPSSQAMASADWTFIWRFECLSAAL